jgi:hypothetical protein
MTDLSEDVSFVDCYLDIKSTPFIETQLESIKLFEAHKSNGHSVSVSDEEVKRFNQRLLSILQANNG